MNVDLTAVHDDPVICTIVSGLRKEFFVRRIILFGSRASNCHFPDSDYDILAEVDETSGRRIRELRAQRAFADREWSMDLLVLTTEEIIRSRLMLGSVVAEAERTGKLIYAAS